MYICLGKSRIIGKFIRLGLFLLQDTAGSTAIVEYIEYLLDSGSNNPNTWEIAQSSSEMAKIAQASTGNPRIFGTIAVLLHTDREINYNFL